MNKTPFLLKVGSPSLEVEKALAALSAANLPNNPPFLGMSSTRPKQAPKEIAWSNLYVNLVHSQSIRLQRPADHTMADHALAKFRDALSPQDFNSLMGHFAFPGYEPVRLNDIEVENILSKLRSINIARYYIPGYDSDISFLSQCLTDFTLCDELSEEEQVLSIAKIVYLTIEIFCGGPCPLEYYESYDKNKYKGTTIVDYLPDHLPSYKLVHLDDDQTPFGPESLCTVASFLKKYGPKCIETEGVMFEFYRLYNDNLPLLKEILNFAELEFSISGETWSFRSSNCINPYNTLGAIKKLKEKVHPEYNVYGVWGFLNAKPQISMEEMLEFALAIKMVNCANEGNDVSAPFSDAAKEQTARYYSDCTERVWVYRLLYGIYVGGTTEFKRIEHYINSLYSREVELFSKQMHNKASVRQVLNAVIMALQLGCIHAAKISKAMKIAWELIRTDADGVLNTEMDPADLAEAAIKFNIPHELLIEWGKKEEPVIIESDSSESSPISIDNTSVSDSDGNKMNFTPEDPLEWLIHQMSIQIPGIPMDDLQRNIIASVLFSPNTLIVEQCHKGKINIVEFFNEMGFCNPTHLHEYLDRCWIDADLLLADAIKLSRRRTQKSKQGKTLSTSELNRLRLYYYLRTYNIACGDQDTRFGSHKDLRIIDFYDI